MTRQLPPLLVEEYSRKDCAIITVALLATLAAPYWVTGIFLALGVL